MPVPPPDFARELLALSDAAPGDRELVLALVRWLDLRMIAAIEADAPDAPEQQLLARLLVAAGEGPARRLPTVRATVEAARAYADDPSDARYEALQSAATASYPFGPGNSGCYAVDELGVVDCGPGSGCTSGAGSIAHAADLAGYDVAGPAIRRALAEWLSQDQRSS